MQHLEVSCAVRPIKWPLGVKLLIINPITFPAHFNRLIWIMSISDSLKITASSSHPHCKLTVSTVLSTYNAIPSDDGCLTPFTTAFHLHCMWQFSCSLTWNTPQTTHHLIVQCTKLTAQRNDLIKQIKQTGGTWPMTNAKLISDYLPNFVKFIKSIDFTDL